MYLIQHKITLLSHFSNHDDFNFKTFFAKLQYVKENNNSRINPILDSRFSLHPKWIIFSHE